MGWVGIQRVKTTEMGERSLSHWRVSQRTPVAMAPTSDHVSYDNYSSLDDHYYHEILTIANGKPIGLGEVGSPPPPEVLLTQPNGLSI